MKSSNAQTNQQIPISSSLREYSSGGLYSLAISLRVITFGLATTATTLVFALSAIQNRQVWYCKDRSKENEV